MKAVMKRVFIKRGNQRRVGISSLPSGVWRDKGETSEMKMLAAN